jgi:DNA-binding NarL/FixJ family response regulator
MNAAIGYVLIALAIFNLAGLLFLFRRFGVAPKVPKQQAPVPAAEATQPSPAASSEPAIPSEALASMLRRLENRLGDIEDQVRRGPTVTMPNEPGGNTDRALALAQRLARQGASAKDIAETCGISLTEAELLHRLHASR